jgi:hypothetical protein
METPENKAKEAQARPAYALTLQEREYIAGVIERSQLQLQTALSLICKQQGLAGAYTLGADAACLIPQEK